MDYSLPGSSVHAILQARILEWVAVSYSRGSSWPRDHIHVSCVSCIGSRFFFFFFFFSHCATWEALGIQYIIVKSCPALPNPTNCSLSAFSDLHCLPDLTISSCCILDPRTYLSCNRDLALFDQHHPIPQVWQLLFYLHFLSLNFLFLRVYI